MSQQDFQKSVEQSFRNAADNPFEEGEEVMSALDAICRVATVVIIVIATALAIGFAIGRATAPAKASGGAIAHSFDTRWLYLDAIDLDFERHVDAEAKALRP